MEYRPEGMAMASGRRSGVARLREVVWLPSLWALAVSGAAGVSAGVGAFVFDRLTVAEGLGFGAAPLGVVVATQVVCLGARYRRAARTLATNVVSLAAGAVCVLEVLRQAEAISTTTVVLWMVSAAYWGTAIVLLCCDGDEVAGRRETKRSVRERFGARPTLWIVVWVSVASGFLTWAGALSGGPVGVLVGTSVGAAAMAVGAAVFVARDRAAGHNGHWP